MVFSGAALAAWAETATPITVKQFMARAKLDASSHTRLGSAEPREQYDVEGYVQAVHLCPPCPKGAMCEPCANTVVLADAPGSCTPDVPCPGGLIIELDYPNNYPGIAPGTKLRLHVETSMTVHTTHMQTEANRKQGAKNQQILKDTLDKQPNLEQAERPAWLKDVPGETYRTKKPDEQ